MGQGMLGLVTFMAIIIGERGWDFFHPGPARLDVEKSGGADFGLDGGSLREPGDCAYVRSETTRRSFSVKLSGGDRRQSAVDPQGPGVC